MTTDPRVPQLLDELLTSHGMPEEVCQSCPELLPEVRKRWQRIRRLCADLDIIFPPPDDAPRPSEPTQLPQVPGYEVEGVLGRGGMGIVFRARHLGLNRPVALKMALGGTYTEPQARARFQREAQAAAGLRHSNIVQVYNVGEVDGRPYFTMELIDGQTLAQKLLAAPQPVQQAARLAATLADAVEAAHACGIVHRDLKPANILLTDDGTPKITDFGLARRETDDASLTQSGVAVGTPSYMAPEQARGHAHAVGPTVDVYSLGAILYEMLTGRPPFRGGTPAETVLQVMSQEVVPPSQLYNAVPRDLETICLKCLNKEPSRRYGTAAELAADLLRFQRGEPILARRAGPIERLVKWSRRHRSLSAFIVSGFLLLMVLLTGVTSMLVERAVLAREVEDDFKQVVKAQRDQKWGEARTALEQGKARLGSGGPSVLVRRAAQLNRELKLVGTLEEILLSHQDTNSPDVLDRSTAVRYEEALREAGLVHGMEDPTVVAARIRATGIALPILAALDDWAHDWVYEYTLPDKSREEWLLKVARLVDDNPASRKIRDAKLWENKAALEEFAKLAQLSNESVPFLTFLGSKLDVHGGDALGFFKRMQQAHVNSFQANMGLANSLVMRGKPAESLRYYQAAMALQPNHAALRHNLGKALADLGQMDEALVELKEANRLAPNRAFYSTSIGRALNNQGRLAEAEQQFRKVLETNPDYAYCLTGLGHALFYQGRHAEAIEVYNRAIALDPNSSPGSKSYILISKKKEISPNYAEPYRQLKESYLILQRWEEAQNAWQQWLSFNTQNYPDWDGYAELCLYLGNESEYRRVRTELFNRFSDTTDPRVAELTGRACLLLPATDEELKQATALIDQALAVEKPDPPWLTIYFRFAKAMAEYRGGHFQNALELLQGDTLRILPPAPGLLLAMVEHQLGQPETAIKTFNAAIAGYDWDPANVKNRESWMYHSLRREAEVVLASKP